jgi:hypothetical protein
MGKEGIMAYCRITHLELITHEDLSEMLITSPKIIWIHVNALLLIQPA